MSQVATRAAVDKLYYLDRDSAPTRSYRHHLDIYAFRRDSIIIDKDSGLFVA